jgi:hypothetical protein
LLFQIPPHTLTRFEKRWVHGSTAATLRDLSAWRVMGVIASAVITRFTRIHDLSILPDLVNASARRIVIAAIAARPWTPIIGSPRRAKQIQVQERRLANVAVRIDVGQQTNRIALLIPPRAWVVIPEVVVVSSSRVKVLSSESTANLNN